jgi:hypothetical protein
MAIVENHKKGNPMASANSLRASGCLLLVLTTLSGAAVGEDIVTPDGGIYVGPLAGGLRQGKGQVTWSNGTRYEGQFEAGVYSGPGRLQTSGGHVYEGNFSQGMMSGQGRLVLANGSVYVGAFKNNQFHGKGRFEQPGGYVYEGDFENDTMQGRGRLSDGNSVYEGEFRQGMFAGQGELVYKDGRQYRGGFERGLFQGKGRFEAPNGDVYEGDFVKGEFTGQGRFASRDGRRHEGSFVSWRPQGPGKFTDAESAEYSGDFSDGDLKKGRVTGKGVHYEGELSQYRPHGQGTLRLANGDTYVGGFAFGRFDGEGTLTHARPGPDGRTQERGVWRFGRLPDAAAERQAAANVETALYGQRAVLDQALAALTPRDPGKINLYLLTVAGDGKQEVFRREAEFVRQQFNESFGTQGHSLALINSRNTAATAPMATLTSLRESLSRMATLMDKEKDILFLYLTSHGSTDHQFSLAQEKMELADLRADELARLLKESGIRWKVVVVSACYSGGFVAPLKDDHTLVITAARHDRASFGCSDENDFTYFGRAFFKEALPQSASFQDAFRRAEKLVAQWEADDMEKDNADKQAGDAATAAAKKAGDDEYRSLPQMVSAAPIDNHLKQWWKQLRRGQRK